MKLSKRRAFVALLVVAICVLLGTLVARRETPRRLTDTAVPNNASKNEALPAHHEENQSAGVATPEADQQYEVIKDRRERELQRLSTTQIKFFGKVIDQEQRPVVGARTKYTIHNLSFRGNPTIQGPLTDSEGRFEIFGQGPAITVSVEHSDYHKGPVAEKRLDYAVVGAAVQLPPTPPTKDTPAVFILQEKGTTEPLIHYRRIESRLPLSGTPVFVDLLSGTVRPGANSLKLILNSDGASLPLNEFYPFNWWLTIEVTNGGVADRRDKIDFQAPVDGYSALVKFDMSPEALGDKWTSRLDQEFFVEFPSGLFGRFHLTVSAEKGLCIIESYLNPTVGSRNLEYDPAKEIKPR